MLILNYVRPLMVASVFLYAGVYNTSLKAMDQREQALKALEKFNHVDAVTDVAFSDSLRYVAYSPDGARVSVTLYTARIEPINPALMCPVPMLYELLKLKYKGQQEKLKAQRK